MLVCKNCGEEIIKCTYERVNKEFTPIEKTEYYECTNINCRTYLNLDKKNISIQDITEWKD